MNHSNSTSVLNSPEGEQHPALSPTQPEYVPQCVGCGATDRDADLHYARVTDTVRHWICWNGDECQRRAAQRDADLDQRAAA